MSEKVLMPQFGESVVEGTITRWLKAEGDSIEEYEPLVEVNTDKVDTEIPSPSSGTVLKILVPEGQTAEAGTLLAWIGEPGEAVSEGDQAVESAILAPATAEAAAPSPESGAAEGGGEIRVRPGQRPDLGFISPVVARMAEEYQIDLTKVQGSGRGGRITKKDIQQYLDTVPVPASAPSPAAGPPEAAPPAAAAGVPPAKPGELIQLNPIRKAIAEHMVFSKHTSPHVTTVMEADLNRITAHRAENKAVFARDGVNLTFTAYFVSASVVALKAYPLVNSSWTEAGIQIHRQINVGMATSLGDEGLIVPVVKNADTLSLLGIARAVNDLSDRARRKHLQPQEVQGGTFTITNHGTSGSLFASPIINQPQCAILGVGVIQKRVVVIDDAIAIRPMVYLTLTFDHRILDGAIADYFLGKIVDSLQHWGDGAV